MLDHLVAGGLPHGISCGDNLVKECEEDAGIVKSIASQAIPVGVVSYMDIDGYRYKRDVLFCYDLKLPESFVPKNQDGEVGSFRLIPVELVADVIQKTEFFKLNCNLVIIDFLFRHGGIDELISDGKSHGPSWLIGRHAESAKVSTTTAPRSTYIQECYSSSNENGTPMTGGPSS
ncbi:Nudix hydrolase domain-containing protein [Heracleum sosnowskyi]|uniref:Nudix hydrolase domain-containing protein n=1 Tax=Heracleum sosnowskyi TaxID=360622 RepID=A0AAD8M5T0_9APIA|nr:Nudix hydrolase domain-containing protein [Heracleum sosnowskyi]